LNSTSQLTFRMLSLFKHLAIYGTSDLFLRLTAIVTVPIYTRIFSPSEYGVWNVIATVVGLLIMLIAFGSHTTYSRFFFDAKTREEKKIVTSTWFLFLTVWSFSAVAVCLLLSSTISQWAFGTDKHSFLFSLGLAAAPISLINEMAGQLLRNDFRAKLFSVLNILSVALTIAFSLYGAVILELGLVGVIGGALFAALIMVPIRLWTARSMLGFCFSSALLKRMLRFGTPLVPTTVAYWIFGMSDRLMLSKLSTLDEVGLYGIAASVASVMAMVNTALGQAWAPTALKMYEEDQAGASIFFGQVMTYIMLGFGFLCLLVTTFAEEVLAVLSTPQFYPAEAAVGPLALGFFAAASGQVTALSISLRMKTKYFAYYSWLAALLNLVLNFIFIPKWGMLAASWATTVSYVFLSSAYFVTSQRLWRIKYQHRQVLVIILVTVGFTAGLGFAPELKTPWEVFSKVGYLLAYITVMLALGVIDLREWSCLVSETRNRGIMWIRAKL
jgi:O-antigen/teichoic acid export membrane protein